ncbi:hypothetical protein [Glutamicibacter ardleyensis]|uniref:Uncharacterized protein n=1 Tax=Glutamicibacter ardleyensis TaxID=225894 RepID=A0ABQ2DIV5_9MICC|nr:hypothetical protein [Glutamicibacter ardleyensis]GGJ59127.1 hypothetical protein GCM10007173_17340 [Glutamicibacter ardleyensis]
MTSKTFKSAKSLLELHIVRTNEDLVRFIICTEGESFASLDIHPATIPALALAILEAAGVEARSIPSARLGTSEHLSDTAYELSTYIEKQQRATAEAKEQAELEAEALELANSAVLVVGNPPYRSIEHMSDTSLRKWLAVARKAREMRKS